jgi:hypothetical protein
MGSLRVHFLPAHDKAHLDLVYRDELGDDCHGIHRRQLVCEAHGRESPRHGHRALPLLFTCFILTISYACAT